MIPLILAGASLLSSGIGTAAKYRSQSQMDAYNRKVEAARKKEAKRQAILSILGSDVQLKPYEDPTAPNLDNLNKVAAISDFGAQALGQAAGYYGSKTTTTKK